MTRSVLSVFAAMMLFSAPAGAQTLKDDQARLQLAGQYIGVHARIYAVGERCNYNVQGLYGPEVALNKLGALIQPQERDTLEAYLVSSEFMQSQQTIEQDVTQAYRRLTADQGMDAPKACVTLLERAIKTFKAVENRLGELHPQTAN